MPPRIRVVGSLNIDFTTTTGRFPGPGETLTAKSLSINAGGKGANQAVACGRASFISKTKQDVLVDMVGAVGANDPYYASMLRPTLEDAGVNCDGIVEVDEAQTGTATIIVDESSGGENRILVVPGANHGGMGDVEEVLERALKEPLPEVFVMQGEIPRATVLALLGSIKTMEKMQPLVILNPAPVYKEGIPKDLLDIPARLTLIVNETELLQCAQTSEGFELTVDLEGELNRTTLDGVAKDFHRAGVTNLIVTLGSMGVYCSCDSHQDKTLEQMLIPGIEVDHVVDTTAAGDTFVGVFAAELARFADKDRDPWKGYDNKKEGDSFHDFDDFDLRGALFRANGAAAQCVQRSGAMQSIPWGYEQPVLDKSQRPRNERIGYYKFKDQSMKKAGHLE